MNQTLPNPSQTKPTPNARIISLCELDQETDGPGEPLLDTLHPLLRVKTRVQVCVGSVELSVSDLLNVRQDQVLALDRLITQPVDLLVEGKVVARGHLLAVNDRFAVRISELPQALPV